ncbi:hypothetical protein BDV12DRAFT_204131 [Aspergillus spectabilis]
MRMAQLLQSQPPQEEILRNSLHMIAQMIAKKLRQQQQQMALIPIWGPSPDVQSWRNMPNMAMEPSIHTTWRYIEMCQQRLVAQEYTVSLEQAAMGFTEGVMRQDQIKIAAAHAQAKQQ